jgi:hypothetical protein
MWPHPDYFWPGSRVETLDEFRRVFAIYGYEQCGTGLDAGSDALEPGYEKIALYMKGETITHVSRQLSDGAWTSKLGRSIDVRHAGPNTLPMNGMYSCVSYGVAMYFFRRRVGFVMRLRERLIRTLSEIMIETKSRCNQRKVAARNTTLGGLLGN